MEIKQATVERLLDLPFGSLSDEENLKLPETQALLRLIKEMPWLLEVAEHKFDPEAAQLILQREVINLKLEDKWKK